MPGRCFAELVGRRGRILQGLIFPENFLLYSEAVAIIVPVGAQSLCPGLGSGRLRVDATE